MNGRASTSVRLIYAHKQTHTSARRAAAAARYTRIRGAHRHTAPLSTTRYTSSALFCFQADRTYTQCLRPNLPFLSPSPPLVRSLALTPTRIGAAGCTTRAHVRYTHLLRTDEVTHSRREGEGGGRGGGEKEEDRSTERASDYFGSTGRWYLRAALSNRTRQPTFSSPLSISRFTSICNLPSFPYL